MDRIMPIDLERPELRRKLRGYEPAVVDRLLNGAAKSLQELLLENAGLREELSRQRAASDLARKQEETLKEILVAAQRSADETRSCAHREAEAILEQARQAAMAERLAGQQQLSEARWELERVRSERTRYADEFRALLERHQRELSYISGQHFVDLTVVTGEADVAASA